LRQPDVLGVANRVAHKHQIKHNAFEDWEKIGCVGCVNNVVPSPLQDHCSSRDDESVLAVNENSFGSHSFLPRGMSEQ
jgi:hypothetical protein